MILKHQKEWIELSLFESTDIVQDTREAVEKETRKLFRLYNFHCILRTHEREHKNRLRKKKRFRRNSDCGFQHCTAMPLSVSYTKHRLCSFSD